MSLVEKKPALVISLVATALFILITLAVYSLSTDGGRQAVSQVSVKAPVVEPVKTMSGAATAFKDESLFLEKKPAQYTYNKFSFDSAEKGVGLTAQEHAEEKMNSLLQEGDYQQADGLYAHYKKSYPDTAMAHRYPHLKARIQALSAE